jgi:hypothetical protein
LQRFRALRRGFPDDANIVRAGGWYNLERLALDPKQEIVNLVVEGLKSTEDSKVQSGKSYTTHENEKLEALELLLYGMGKGFEADLVDGEWDLVFTKQGKKSPAFQKLVGKAETAKRSKNIFDIKSMTFCGDVQFWKFGKVSTKVKVGTEKSKAENVVYNDRSSPPCNLHVHCVLVYSLSLSLSIHRFDFFLFHSLV